MFKKCENSSLNILFVKGKLSFEMYGHFSRIDRQFLYLDFARITIKRSNFKIHLFKNFSFKVIEMHLCKLQSAKIFNLTSYALELYFSFERKVFCERF